MLSPKKNRNLSLSRMTGEIALHYRLAETRQEAAQFLLTFGTAARGRVFTCSARLLGFLLVVTQMSDLCLTRWAPIVWCPSVTSKVVSGSWRHHQIIFYWPSNWETSTVYLHYVTENRSCKSSVVDRWSNDEGNSQSVVSSCSANDNHLSLI